MYSAREFIEKFEKNEVMTVVERAGTNYAWFSQIAYGHGRPSVDLAHKLVAASDGRLSFKKLLPPKTTAA